MPRKSSETPDTDAESKGPGSRPIWTGSIAFGLVNVPVSLHSLDKKNELQFKMLDGRNKARIRFVRVNDATGKEVPYDQIVKAYEYSDDNYIVIDEAELAKVAIEATKTIDVEEFVLASEIDPLFFEKPYLLLPKKKAEKGYVLLREVMKKSQQIGIARMVIRTREYVAALMPQGDAMVIILMRYVKELRDISDYNLPSADFEKYNISDKEMALAEQLVASMSAKWDPTQYRDEYRDAVMEWIELQATSGKTTTLAGEAEKKQETTNVVDLATLLRQSMEAGTKPGEKKKSNG